MLLHPRPGSVRDRVTPDQRGYRTSVYYQVRSAARHVDSVLTHFVKIEFNGSALDEVC